MEAVEGVLLFRSVRGCFLTSGCGTFSSFFSLSLSWVFVAGCLVADIFSALFS